MRPRAYTMQVFLSVMIILVARHAGAGTPALEADYTEIVYRASSSSENSVESTTTGKYYRDAMLRSRFEVGPSALIRDPVAGVTVVLDANAQTADRFSLATPGGQISMSEGVAPGEDLGSHEVDGRVCKGTSMTSHIPANSALGNTNDISYSVEVWVDEELVLPVLITTESSQTGRKRRSFSNVVETTPDPALFQIPAGYTITDH